MIDQDKPDGCATCPNAESRFNGGRGATTCGLLGGTIVAYGHGKPATRPGKCPHDTTITLDRARALGGRCWEIGGALVCGQLVWADPAIRGQDEHG